MIIGFMIGVISGAMQFIMLSKFTSSVTSASFNKKTVIFAVIQFLLPLVVLVGCAFLIEGGLLWAAVGMSASLMLCAVTRFFLSNRK